VDWTLTNSTEKVGGAAKAPLKQDASVITMSTLDLELPRAAKKKGELRLKERTSSRLRPRRQTKATRRKDTR